MNVKMERFIEEIKDKADLVDVIEKTSTYRFGKRAGRYVKCQKPDSLVVDPDWGQYTWFAHAGDGAHNFETGDVFSWMQRHGGKPEFWDAATFLAEMYGVRIPEWKRDDGEAGKIQKSAAQLMETACAWFEAQLWKTPAALEYARGRGWTDETLRAARLGFSGGTFDAVNDLAGELSMNGMNLRDAAAVALTGMRGNVAAWLSAQGIESGSPDWVEQDRIPGMAAMPCLVYPHVWRGRVVYFSARRLEWATRDGAEFAWGMLKSQMENIRLIGKEKPKSYNLPDALAGARQRYFNQAFHKNAEEVIIVEGQADAISLGQLGFSAVALCGVGADKALAELLKKVGTVYVALDNDSAGRKNMAQTAEQFGPMARILTWEAAASGDDYGQ